MPQTGSSRMEAAVVITTCVIRTRRVVMDRCILLTAAAVIQIGTGVMVIRGRDRVIRRQRRDSETLPIALDIVTVVDTLQIVDTLQVVELFVAWLPSIPRRLVRWLLWCLIFSRVGIAVVTLAEAIHSIRMVVVTVVNVVVRAATYTCIDVQISVEIVVVAVETSTTRRMMQWISIQQVVQTDALTIDVATRLLVQDILDHTLTLIDGILVALLVVLRRAVEPVGCHDTLAFHFDLPYKTKQRRIR